jgi:succinoglycan biosynthesis transport protein ExoP
MQPSRYISAIYRRWIVVVVAAVLGVAVAAFISSTRTTQYRASTSMFFSVSGASSISDLSQSATYTQNLMQSFAAVATTSAVLDPVNQQLGLRLTDSKLAKMVHVKVPAGTVVLQISVVGPSAQQAATIANDVATQLSKSVGTLSPAVAQSGAKQLSATFAPAPVPRSALATSGKKKLYVEGFVGGLILGICLALLREVTDTRVRTEEDLLRVSGTPVLGRVDYSRDKPLLVGDTEGRAGESFRALRANVFALRATGARSVVVTASSHGEGATTTAINLALVAAETGLRVLLVEANLRHPAAARYLKLRETPGLISVLAKPSSLAETVQKLPGYAVDVLPAGGAPTNPGEIIGSPEMAELVSVVVADYDLVVFDAAALLTSTDAAVLTRYNDGALVVVDTRKTRRRDLAGATASLHRAAAVLLGVVLNKTSSGRGHADKPPSGQGTVRLGGKPSAAGAVGGGLSGDQRRAPGS